ncbi:MAG: DUF3298 domain-containing protein [Planctomycetes bacterium]|nr:DUF3298 domain-containing protein [Planctomycetota bacterium]
MSASTIPACEPADHPPRRRRQWPLSLRLFMLILLALPCVGVVAIVWRARPLTQIQVDQRACFEGLAGDVPAFLDIRLNDMLVSADWSVADGGTLDLIGGLKTTPELTLTRPYAFLDSNDEPGDGQIWKSREARLVLAGDPLARQVTGRWSDGAGVEVPVTLTRIARGQILRRTAGLIFQGRGRAVEYVAHYPILEGTDPLGAATQHALEQRVRQDAQENAGLPWNDLDDCWMTFREPSALNNWSCTDTWDVQYRDRRLVSLLCSSYQDTGGAHGNFRFDVLTVWWNGQTVEQDQLADFFQPDTPWRDALIALCCEDLQRQEASAATAVQKIPEMLEQFTIRPDGLHVHFPPYAVGCYAEGPYEVCLPFSRLSPYLCDTGPATALPAPPDRLASDHPPGKSSRGASQTDLSP